MSGLDSEDYEKALRHAEAGVKLSAGRPLEFDIRIMIALYHLGRFDECIDRATEVLASYDTIKSKNQDLLKYLKCFIAYLAQYAVVGAHGQYDVEHFPQFEFYYEDIPFDINAVPDRALRTYQLQTHPDWYMPDAINWKKIRTMSGGKK